MKNLVLIAISAALFLGGVYVGRSPQIVVNVPDIQVKCKPRQSEPETSRIGNVVAAPAPEIRPAPSPSPSPSTLPAEAPLAKAEESKTEEKKEGTFTSDDHEETTCDKWIKNTVESATRYIGKYEMDSAKIVMNNDEYQCLSQLRTSLDTANLVVSEEGRLTVGSYVYYLLVRQK